MKLEISRKIINEFVFNQPLKWINIIDNFVPLEIVDRSNNDIKFRYIYVSKLDKEYLFNQIDKRQHICNKIFIEVDIVHNLLQRYSIKHIDITNELCNYCLL